MYKMCNFPDCKIRPVFNFEGQTTALYCNSHKLEEMIYVKNKTCCYSNCKIRPNFNFEGQKTALYCILHKLEGMIDIKHKTCIHDGCKTRPAYNYQSETKVLYCSSHKLDGMVNVISKTCIHPDCKILPSCNFEGKTKRLYCVNHKLDGMVNIMKETCINENCKITASYNYEYNKKGLYCVSHKLDGMINVKNITCKTHLCYISVNNDRYDGYCLRCYINLFPDKPVSRNYKTKEFAVVNFVKNKFDKYNWLSDKIIVDGCSKKRPDLLLDLGYQIIIIEIDENQHADYDCSCENKRIMEISQDLGHRPIVFIRFNPDDYNTNDKKITSCWGLNGKGICVVKKSKKDEWDKRLDALEQQINYWLNPEHKTDKMIEIIQLFYDNN